MTQELTVQQNSSLTSYALPLSEIKAQVNLIQHVMKEIMKENEHYGIIPGCGKKATLLKPGAEKIMMAFRLSNDTEIERIELPREHREYSVKCTLYSPEGQRLGTGVGSCTTMEGKFRFRVGGGEVTEIPVTKAYWDAKKEDIGKANKILKTIANAAGLDGDKFGTKKNEAGQWVITTFSGERIEHDNPADYYNTCLKMAKKRALVDATLTTTAASDIFTQDIEDMPEVIPGARVAEKKPEIETKKPEIIPQTKEQGFEIENLLASSDLSKLSKEWQDFLKNDLSRLDNKTATDVIATLRSLPAKSVQEEKA